MFAANAPPANTTCLFAATMKVPEIWKIQVSVGVPVNVKSALIVVPVSNAYTPAAKSSPPSSPPFRFVESGARLLASV